MNNIREYCEEYPVDIEISDDVEQHGGRWVITATNEGGHNSTQVDLVDVLNYVKITGMQKLFDMGLLE